MKVRHLSGAKKDDLKFFKRLLPLFVKRMESHINSKMDNYENWRNEDSLKAIRQRLLELTQSAITKRQDGLMKALESDTLPNVKDNPYIEIAVLAAVCHYHLDSQMKDVINSLLGE